MALAKTMSAAAVLAEVRRMAGREGQELVGIRVGRRQVRPGDDLHTLDIRYVEEHAFGGTGRERLSEDMTVLVGRMADCWFAGLLRPDDQSEAGWERFLSRVREWFRRHGFPVID